MLKRDSGPPPQDRLDGIQAARIGRRLRDAREARGRSVASVASWLRIHPSYVEALEGGEFVRIPERPDVTDALRTYIDYLDLDGEELVASAQSAADRADAPSGHGERGPLPGPRRRKSVMMAVLLVLAAASYVGYRVGRQPDPATARLTATVHGGTATDMPRGREAERTDGPANTEPTSAGASNETVAAPVAMAAGDGPEPPARDVAGGPATVGSSHPVAARPAGEAVDAPPALPGGDAAIVLPDGSDGLAVLTGSTPAAVGAAAAPGDEPPAPDRSDVAALPPALSAPDGPAMVGPAPAPPATGARVSVPPEAAAEAPAAVGAAAAPGDEPPAPDRSDVATLPPALSARDGPAMVGPAPAPPATEARPAAASPQPPARPPVVGRYAIQVAAVRDPAGVYREWRRLAERHPGLGALGLRPPQRVEIRGGGTFYRVIVGAFATRADAQAACGRLREDGSCRTIVP